MKKILTVLVIVVVIAALAIGLYYLVFLHLKPAVPQKPKVLRVGTSPDFPPFEYIDEVTGEVLGIDIDLIKAIAEKLGYEIEIVQMEFAGLIPALEQGHIDVAISGITITEERAKRVDFSIPYWEADQTILVVKGSRFKPQSLEDLAGRVVGVQSGTTAEKLLDELREKGVEVEIKRYPQYTLAVQDLVNGRTDAVVVDSPVANALVKLYNVEISCTIPTGEKYGIAVRKGNTELLEQINNVLKTMLSSDEWHQIVSRYLG